MGYVDNNWFPVHIKAKFYVEPPWEGGGKKVYINGTGHMTKMAATTIYGKIFKNLLLQNCHMIMKLGMEHYVLTLFESYMNDNPELTLSYFTTNSNSEKLVFVLIVDPDIR